MRLDELLERLAPLDDDAKLFAAPPYTADSEASFGTSAREGLTLVCDVRTARALLAPYVADPIAMRVARFRIEAQRVDAAHRASLLDAHTVWFAGCPAGYFKAPYPTGAGTYPYEPYRSLGHYDLLLAVDEGQRPTCRTPGYEFTVLAIPALHVIEIGDFVVRPSGDHPHAT